LFRSLMLRPMSPWFQVAELAVTGLLTSILAFLLNSLLVIFALLAIPSLIERFRNAGNPYYTSLPASGCWAMALAWIGLVIYLGVMSLQANTLLAPFAR